MTRFILFLLLIYCGYLLWRYVKKKFLMLDRSDDTTFRKEPSSIAELVQDPQCGVYIVKDKAIKVNIDGREVYFCSEACRGKYLERKEGERKS
ncbi:MAG: hypothetical protein N2260_01505 [Syntrophobacterales bacterium]|nr:hypothetical protein [Syntrophobacterales bacterium]